jgi:hypothetical protein
MRSLTILLVAIHLSLFPYPGFAQTQSTALQSVPQSASCREGKIQVRIKLKNGNKVKGGLLEKSDDAIQVCDNGISRSFSTSEIKEIKTLMTGSQRTLHTFKVLGIAWGIAILLGLARYLASE